MAYYSLLIVALIAIVSVNSVYGERLLFDGRDATPETQCKSRGPFEGVCKTSDPAERCLNMKCADTASLDIPLPWNVGPALQGTWCGDKKICIAGQCTDDPNPPENPPVIKDFQFDCEEPW